MAIYDTDRALDVLGAFAEVVDKYGAAEERQKAAMELLASVATLGEKSVGIRSGPGGAGQRAAWVAVGDDATAAVILQGSTFYVQHGDKHVTVPLVFNRRLQRFEGAELDDPAIPRGEPKRRRDALLELMMCVVALMRNPA